MVGGSPQRGFPTATGTGNSFEESLAELQRLESSCAYVRAVKYAGTTYATFDQADGCHLTADWPSRAGVLPMIGYQCETYYPPDWSGPRTGLVPDSTGGCAMPTNIECEQTVTARLLLDPATGLTVDEREHIWWPHEYHNRGGPYKETPPGRTRRRDARITLGNSLETMRSIEIGISPDDGRWIAQRRETPGNPSFLHYNEELGDSIHGVAGSWAILRKGERLQRVDIETGKVIWFADNIASVNVSSIGIYTWDNYPSSASLVAWSPESFVPLWTRDFEQTIEVSGYEDGKIAVTVGSTELSCRESS